MMRDEVLERAAARYYDAALPYHNFSHALETIRSGAEIVARCRDDNVSIDEAVVYYALLFHDAGYHEDHLQKGFPTKERYSAAIAADVLRSHGVAAGTIDKVVAAIHATQRDARFVTNEEKAVRAADLAGLAADYGTFRGNTENLKHEYEMLTGRAIGWGAWITQVREVLDFFLSQDIRLTRYYFDADGGSLFHKRTRSNLDRLQAETAGL
jgi:predicted metal-dependent HD superfamily phosphohydrolase